MDFEVLHQYSRSGQWTYLLLDNEGEKAPSISNINGLCENVFQDLAWLQCWFYTGHIFGSLALLWSFFMMIKSYCYARYEASIHQYL